MPTPVLDWRSRHDERSTKFAIRPELTPLAALLRMDGEACVPVSRSYGR